MIAPDLYFTGAGGCCSLGTTATATASAYRKGIPAFFKPSDLVGVDGLAPTLAPVIPVADCRDYAERLGRLFSLAIDDFRKGEGGDRVCANVRLVLPPWLETHPSRKEVLRLITHALGREAPLSRVDFGGPCAFFAALDDSARALSVGENALVGALDSFMHPDLLDVLTIRGRMLSRDNPHGSVPSEAAFIIRVARCAPHEPKHRSRLIDVVSGREQEDITTPKGLIGRGLASVFRKAASTTDGARTSRLMVGLTGERWRAEELGFALSATADTYGGFAADIETPLAITGDCGTASGALMLALALVDEPSETSSAKSGVLIAESSRDGARTACLLERGTALSW